MVVLNGIVGVDDDGSVVMIGSSMVGLFGSLPPL